MRDRMEIDPRKLEEVRSRKAEFSGSLAEVGVVHLGWNRFPLHYNVDNGEFSTITVTGEPTLTVDVGTTADDPDDENWREFDIGDLPNP